MNACHASIQRSLQGSNRFGPARRGGRVAVSRWWRMGLRVPWEGHAAGKLPNRKQSVPEIAGVDLVLRQSREGFRNISRGWLRFLRGLSPPSHPTCLSTPSLMWVVGHACSVVVPEGLQGMTVDCRRCRGSMVAAWFVHPDSRLIQTF